MRLYLPGAGTLGCVVWTGARIACSHGNPPDFYPPYVKVGLLDPQLAPVPLYTTLHPLPPQLWDSGTPTHLDEYGFFKFLVVRLPYSLTI